MKKVNLFQLGILALCFGAVVPCLAQTTFPKFLTYPFTKESVGIYNGWYYKFDGSGHYGIDYQLDEVDILSSADGVVETVVDNMGNNFNQPNVSPGDKYGNRVVVNHDNDYKTVYAHLKTSTILVKVGDSVLRGQKLAISGNTGWSNAPHLHFEVRGPESDIATFAYGLYKYDPYGIYKKDVSLYTSNSMDDSKRLWLTNPPLTVVDLVGRRSTGPDPNMTAFLGCFMSNGGYEGLGGVWDNGVGDIYVHYWPDNGNPNQPGSADALLVQDLLKVKRDSKGTDNTSDDTFTYSWSQLVNNPRANQTICVKEEILSCWNSHYATLGAPTSAQYYPANGKKQQNFEKGFIWAENGVAHDEYSMGMTIIQTRQVTINTAPQGAEIWNSGMSLGNAPVVGQFYQGYSYNMTAKLTGYQDKAFSFTVGSSDMTVNVTLTAGSSGGSTNPNYILTKALTCKSVDANGYYVNDESEFTGSDTYAYAWVWLSNVF